MKSIVESIEQQFLTKQQARIYSSLSERTLDYARERGALKAYKVGKRVLFKKSDLDAFLERHCADVDLDEIVRETLAALGGGR